MTSPADLPDDIDALKANILASQAKMAMVHAEDEAIDPPKSTASKSRAGRGVLPRHLPRVEEIIAADLTCGCGAERHIIGEDGETLFAIGSRTLVERTVKHRARPIPHACDPPPQVCMSLVRG